MKDKNTAKVVPLFGEQKLQKPKPHRRLLPPPRCELDETFYLAFRADSPNWTVARFCIGPDQALNQREIVRAVCQGWLVLTDCLYAGSFTNWQLRRELLGSGAFKIRRLLTATEKRRLGLIYVRECIARATFKDGDALQSL